jgi:hypothetical protein
MSNRPTSDTGRFRTVPERSPDFTHLSLPALRSYRQALNAEESRVSYWRRIIQARLDLVRAADDGTTPTPDHLQRVFAEARIDSGRTALLTVVPIDDIPPLPDLAELWARDESDGTDEERTALIADLARAEGELSAYRTALHRRLAAATGELIARYRERPELCLSALPGEPAAATA